MGRGRASALKVYAHTYKCQQTIKKKKYSRVIHQKKRLDPLMNEQNIVLQNIENCRSNCQKKLENPTFCRAIHQKQRLDPLMKEQKSVLQNIKNCGSNCQKKLEKSHFLPFCHFFTFFLAITNAIFNILQNGFLLVHQWVQALFLMYNTTIFEKKKFHMCVSKPCKSLVDPFPST